VNAGSTTFATCASNAPKSPELEWVKVNNWLMETKCGKFRCRKYYLGDVLDDPGECRYQLFAENRMRCGPPADSFAKAQQFANGVFR
jgi:hypothetical protein